MPVLNAKTPKFIIVVENKHIEGAVKAQGHLCMFKEAIKDHISTARSIMVDIQTIRFTFITHDNRFMRVNYLTPRAIQNAIRRFDLGIPQTEFRFTLRNGWVVQLRDRSARDRTMENAARRTRRNRGEGKPGDGIAPKTDDGEPRVTINRKGPPRATMGMTRVYGLCYLESLFNKKDTPTGDVY